MPEMCDLGKLFGEEFVVNLQLELLVEAILKLRRQPGLFVRLARMLAHPALPDAMAAAGAAPPPRCGPPPRGADAAQ
jgi:hypothetical protein